MADSNTDHTKPVHVVGPYAVYGRLAAGGMATVHLGRAIDPKQPSRTVAIKRLHPQFSKDPEFVAMFIDEAKLAARIKHPNVVETLDILTMGQELLLVMEYIRGECFSKLLRAARRKDRHPSVEVVGAIASGMLRGLHAAHEVKDEQGELLNVVHRDISPQNVMIGVDGIAKVLDFGVAKASARIQITRDGQMKGKLSYMSPEQLQGQPVDRRADVFACGVVLWEALTRKRLFVAEEAGDVLAKILKEEVPAPSTFVPELSPELDAVVLRALHKDNTQRYQTAEELALDLERIIDVATPEVVGEWIDSVAGEILGKRARLLVDIEASPLEAMNIETTESFNESTAFLQLQSWAEREAARVIAEEEMTVAESLVPGDTAESGVSEDKTSIETSVVVPPGAEVEAANSESLVADDPEDQTAVTIAIDPDFAAATAGARALRMERKTQAPTRVRPPGLPPQFHAPAKPLTLSPSVTPLPGRAAVAGSRKARGTRWGVLLSVAAGVLGISGLFLFQMTGPGGISILPEKRTMALRPVGTKLRTVAEVRNGAEKKPPIVDIDGLPEKSAKETGAVDSKSASTRSVRLRRGTGAKRKAAGRVARTTSAQRKAASKGKSTRIQKRKRVVPVVRRPGRALKSKGSDASDCSRPYWTDARGIRRLKVACL